MLRSGILPLHIETGRFSNTKLDDRICNICNSGDIENEYHFVFHCTYYDEEEMFLCKTLMLIYQGTLIGKSFVIYLNTQLES